MIEVKDISAGYGKKEVLSHLSVAFEKGRLTGLIGTNGCGKSTLLKTVLGILSQSSVSIFIDEKNISNMNRNHIAERL